jgi:YD repeat-containing protein
MQAQQLRWFLPTTGDGPTIAAYSYAHDADGRIIATTSPDGSFTYKYDHDSQLLSATGTALSTSEAYSYDANGNLIQKTTIARDVGIISLSLATGDIFGEAATGWLGAEQAATWGGTLFTGGVAGTTSAASQNALTQLTGDQPFSWDSLYKSTLIGAVTGGATGVIGKGLSIVGSDIANGLVQMFGGSAQAAGGGIFAQAIAGAASVAPNGLSGAVGGDIASQFFQTASNPGGSSGNSGTFSTDSQLQDHFARHGSDFGATTATDYEQQANNFLNSPAGNGVLQKVRANGDIVRYNPVTDEFGVAKSNGVIRTYYKPDPAVHGYSTNLDYFNAQ